MKVSNKKYATVKTDLLCKLADAFDNVHKDNLTLKNGIDREKKLSKALEEELSSKQKCLEIMTVAIEEKEKKLIR